MNNEQLPLPVAMRADELTEQDFETLHKRAVELQAEKKDQTEPVPQKIPMGKRATVSAES